MPAIVPPPPHKPSGGWAGDLLRDPGGTLGQLLGHIGSLLLPVWPVAALLALTALWLRHRHHHRRRDELRTDARQVIVLAPPEVDPAGAEAFWANLVGLLTPRLRRIIGGQPHLACEYLFSATGMTVQLWVPGIVPPGLVERAVEAAWPGARTRTEPARPPLPPPNPGQQLVLVGGQLRLARPEALPLRTKFDADPIRALVGAATGLGRHEHACVQVLARPVTAHRAARARRAGRRLHTGAPSLAIQVLDLITPRPLGTSRAARSTARPPRDPQTSLAYSAHNRAIIEKQRHPPYETLIRYAVTVGVPDTTGEHDLRAAHDRARGRAHALAASFASYTELNNYTRRRLHHPDSALADRHLGRGDLLSVPELAAVAHLPTDAAVPGLRRAGARAVAPPPGIATPGPDAKPLGDTDSGHPRPIGLRVPDARHHLHVIGATGSGKSTLLATTILDDVDAGRGVVLVDPKGDLVSDVLSRLPRSAGDRVVLFDADSRARPPCLNPLDGGDASDTDLTVDNLTSVFRRVYAAFWGPRTDDVMRAACLTLRAQHGTATLADLPTLLTENAFRQRVTAAVTDPVLAGFWTWYTDLTDGARSQAISPLLNKLRAFLLRPFVRDAIAAGPSTVNLTDVLDNGGICLVRIPKGSLGVETTRLVGSLVVARVWQDTTGRARIPQRHRRDASLVIDECHNFLNLPYPIEDMLAEARGFRLAMTLAHQHLGQLPRELRDGLSTNARSKIFFTAGPEDARDLARHTAPRLTDYDLSHLGAYHAAARLVLHGEETEAFTLRTRPLSPAVPGRSREIRMAAHQALERRTAQRRQPNDGTGATTPTTGISTTKPAAATDPRRQP